MKKKSSTSSSKSQKAREELLQFLIQKKENQVTTEEKKKHVRILHSHHTNAEGILNELQQNESDYVERISSLKSYQSITKQSQKEKLFQTEWTDEQTRLQELSWKLEQNVTEIFHSLLFNDVTLSVPINELLATKEKQQNERREMKTIYQNQLQDVNSLIRDFQGPTEANSSNTTRRNSNKKKQGQSEEEIENQRKEDENKKMMVSSLIADLLMKIRLDFQLKWSQLTENEESLEKMIQKDLSLIQAQTKKEILEKQNSQIIENLIQIFQEIDIQDVLDWNKSLAEFERKSLGEEEGTTTDSDLMKESLVQTFLQMTSPMKSPRLSPRQQEQQLLSPRSPHSPRSIKGGAPSSAFQKKESFPIRGKSPTKKGGEGAAEDPSTAMKDTVLELIEKLSQKNNSSIISSEKIQLLLNDSDISPMIFQYLYQIYLMDQEYHRLVEQRKTERQQINEELGIFNEQEELEEGDDDQSLAGSISTGKKKENNANANNISPPASTRTTHPKDTSYGNLPSKSAHLIFCKNYKKAEITGMPRKTLLEILTKELTASYSYLTIDDILLHEQWYRRLKQLSQKYKAFSQSYYQQRNLLISNMKLEIKNVIQEKKEAFINFQNSMKMKCKKELLMSRLLEMKAIRDNRQEEYFKEVQAQKLREEELLLKQQELLEKERNEKKELLNHYYQEKQARERKQKELLDAEEFKEKEKLKELIEANKSKIVFRQQKIEDKRIQMKLMEVREFVCLYYSRLCLIYWDSFKGTSTGRREEEN
jgi:hypothetical protein